MSDNKGIVVSGAIIGALVGGVPGAVVGGLIGAVAQELSELYCPNCKSLMRATRFGNDEHLMCPRCGYQTVRRGKYGQ